MPNKKRKKTSNNKIGVILIVAIIIIVSALSLYFFRDRLPFDFSSLFNRTEETGGNGETGDVYGDFSYNSVLSGLDKVTLPEQFDVDNLTEVHFIDVGQGDAIVIMLPDGKVCIIDAGSGTSVSKATREKYLAYLSDNLNISYIDYMIVTHADSDHYNILPYVVSLYRIGHLYYNVNTKSGYQTFINNALPKVDGTKTAFSSRLSAPITIIGVDYKLSIYVIGSLPGATSATNSNSLITVFEYGGRTVVFTGDAEKGTEEWFVAQLPSSFDADVLKVGHHGSHSSTSDAFLSKIKCEYAVICVGEGNGYNHPHAEPMASLDSKGLATYRTDVHGHVALYIDGDGDFGFAVEKNEPAQNNSVGRNVMKITIVVVTDSVSNAARRESQNMLFGLFFFFKYTVIC